MPGVDGERVAKATACISTNIGSTNSNSGKKKKKPRIRIRIRNKSVAAALATEAANTAQETSKPSEFEEKVNTTIEFNSAVQEKVATVNDLPSSTVDETFIKQKSKQSSSVMKNFASQSTVSSSSTTSLNPSKSAEVPDKTREQIMAEREAKKQAKQARKVKPDVVQKGVTESADKMSKANIISRTVNKSDALPTKTEIKPEATKVSVTGTLKIGLEKSREQVMAEREAKKLAKQDKKMKSKDDAVPTQKENSTALVNGEKVVEAQNKNVFPKLNQMQNSREHIMAEREAKKQAKHAAKAVKSCGDLAEQMKNLTLTTARTTTTTTTSTKAAPLAAQEDKKKPTSTKAERRAIQEAQRAAKVGTLAQKTAGIKTITTTTKKDIKPMKPSKQGSIENPTNEMQNVAATHTITPRTNDCKIKLFNHLECARTDVSLFVNNPLIHPSIARLGEQYAKRTVVGSNARCIAFLNALKAVIHDFETPAKKEFGRSLETFFQSCVDHLQKCRPLAVSMTNAHKHIKHVLTQLPTDKPELELKEHMCHFIDTYIENQIGKAAQAICSAVQEKIADGDVIMTFGCSSLINYIFEEAQRRKVNFRVIVVDSRPFCEGQELLRRLTAKEIPCTYVLINAVSFVMPEASKVLLGAHALLANGYVMARTGTAQVAMVARAFNVPVLVCCETHKFSERYQTDAIVYNELGNPDDLVLNDKCCLSNWQEKGKLSPLNLIYDITPSELITAVVTEVAILPCTSVPVILRIKPTEIGYYS